MRLESTDYLALYLDDNLLLSRKEILAYLKISRSTLYRWVKSGYFPKPIQNQGLTTQVRWKFKDIEQWIDKQR